MKIDTEIIKRYCNVNSLCQEKINNKKWLK